MLNRRLRPRPKLWSTATWRIGRECCISGLDPKFRIRISTHCLKTNQKWRVLWTSSCTCEKSAIILTCSRAVTPGFLSRSDDYRSECSRTLCFRVTQMSDPNSKIQLLLPYPSLYSMNWCLLRITHARPSKNWSPTKILLTLTWAMRYTT